MEENKVCVIIDINYTIEAEERLTNIEIFVLSVIMEFQKSSAKSKNGKILKEQSLQEIMAHFFCNEKNYSKEILSIVIKSLIDKKFISISSQSNPIQVPVEDIIIEQCVTNIIYDIKTDSENVKTYIYIDENDKIKHTTEVPNIIDGTEIDVSSKKVEQEKMKIKKNFQNFLFEKYANSKKYPFIRKINISVSIRAAVYVSEKRLDDNFNGSM